MHLSPLQPVPLSEQATASLQARIERGDWNIGEKLPSELNLATQLGVGRSTVREAVRALVSLGLVQSRQGSGVFVKSHAVQEPDLASRLAQAAIQDVYEVRMGLDIQAARLAVQRRTDQDLLQMNEALRRRRRARKLGRMRAWVDADTDFHTAVVIAAHNPVLLDVYSAFVEPLRATLFTMSAEPDESRDGHDDHVALVAAITNHDAESAVTATVRILETTVEQARVLATNNVNVAPATKTEDA